MRLYKTQYEWSIDRELTDTIETGKHFNKSPNKNTKFGSPELTLYTLLMHHSGLILHNSSVVGM